MTKGRFITFEGPEGAGKTTQARLLIEKLENERQEVLYTREPGGTLTGEAIRGILQYDQAGEEPCPETEVLLFAASRAQLVRKVILPALERGTWIVCDRFADSTTVYQGYGRGFSVDQMLTINEFAIAEAIPSLTILLDLDVDAGFRRIALRQKGKTMQLDRIEKEDRSFHERVRAGYLELAQRWPERFRIIQADRSVPEVADDVWRTVKHELI